MSTNQFAERREIQEVRSIAEKALTLINAHEIICAQRYTELKKTTDKVDTSLKYVHIGIGMMIAMEFLVGIYVALYRF
jgi:hypothetical protein